MDQYINAMFREYWRSGTIMSRATHPSILMQCPLPLPRNTAEYFFLQEGVGRRRWQAAWSPLASENTTGNWKRGYSPGKTCLNVDEGIIPPTKVDNPLRLASSWNDR
eukprot:TRINITY_DN406_c0_g1_i1.p3 TRINITY_DN406_c0_g1~~TRINITY_DN406_c0_g1_i1.p3  ORF type:complete len:107 (+),score=2.56 TRINITY_DN406_c0_g1_i1:421-741(+)